MKNIKHWLFDFDGTLVDSMPHWGAAMVGILDNHGIPHEDDIVKTITPLGTKGTIEYFIKLGLDMSLDEIKSEIFSVLVPLYRDVIVDKPFVADCLRRMKAAGMHLHILTASPHEYLDPCLERIGLYALFDNVWSSDDFGTGKTDPKIYIAAAERIGVTVSDVTFLDDNIHADLTAKSTGMHVVGVYDDTSADSESMMRQSLDGYVNDFAELGNMLGI